MNVVRFIVLFLQNLRNCCFTAVRVVRVAAQNSTIQYRNEILNILQKKHG